MNENFYLLALCIDTESVTVKGSERVRKGS